MIYVLLLLAGIVWLQLFLSKQENKWLGLLLPFLSLCFSILAVLGMAAFTSITVAEQTTITNSGEVIKSIVENAPREQISSTASLILTGIYIFALCNIPTAILLAIYAACRRKRKKNMELEKMSIQDL